MSWFPVKNNVKLSDLTLTKEVQEQVEFFLEDHEFKEALLANGLKPRLNIILHGPPGCGKSSIAQALSSALQIPLYRSDASDLIGSHVGESGKAIAKMLDFVQVNEVVMLLDEFDAIGSERLEPDSSAAKADTQAVNALLTGLDQPNRKGLIVACTNRLGDLDKAVLRRFDSVIEIPNPGRVVLKKIATKILDGRFGIKPEDVIEGLNTPAEVTNKAWDMLRKAVINDERDRRDAARKQLKFKMDEDKKVLQPARRTADLSSVVS